MRKFNIKFLLAEAYNDAVSYDDGVVQLSSLDYHGESVVPERDNGEGAIVEAF